MATLTKSVSKRLTDGLKRFQPILSGARSRDVNESDTSMIIADMLADVFGFDKYTEITRELCIRNTYCDLAIRLDEKVQIIIEVKAIDTTLKDSHVKQAVDYAANQGVEWVSLTNGVEWQVYRVIFGKPIDKELVIQLDLLEMNSRSQQDLEKLFLLTKESMQKSALDEYHDFQQATNKYLLGAIVLSEPVLSVIRRELRRSSPGVRIETAEIRDMLAQDVLKREVLEGDKSAEAKKAVKKSADRKLRSIDSTEGAITGQAASRPTGS
ncbi:MAG: type I restriction enzyme HsdR N-terminal domain-containing protein [Acidobacteria bacterium]|nr:type I restriction enzyme HsdR N-terminal domain-containing protein [Acidobacteriota bacterium]